MKRQLPPNINDEQSNASGNPFKVVYGNLISLAESGHFDAIVHGCNCHCNMGAGIAKAIKERWPEAYAADCKTKKGDRSKMGTYSYAEVDGLTIINLYSQYDYTRNKVDVEYESLKRGFDLVRANFAGKRIGIPLIGAGLAGGSWAIIREIIGDIFKGEDLTLVILKEGEAKEKEPERKVENPHW